MVRASPQRLLFPAVLLAVAAAAPSTGRAPERNVVRGCVEKYDSATDYFPDKAKVEEAVNFRVEYRPSYKVVSVKEAFPGGPQERYVLVQCGAPPPILTGALAGALVVTVPIASVFVLSTTHLSLLVDLDRVDVLSGVAQLDVALTPEVRSRIKAGQVTEFAKAGLVIDVERVVTARPSLLMAGGASNAALSVIRNAGVPVAANTDWLEPTALARAEWMKYMALFLNEERKAESVYGAVRARYRSLSHRATARPEAQRPLVMTGRSSRGMFTIAGGRSYVAALIKDAGGRYVWADDTAVGSTRVDLEAQLQRAANADIWINGGGWKSLTAMLDDEPRYAEFKAHRQGQVWVYERQLTPSGSNDYSSRGVTHPELVLADLIKIFHPGLVPQHAFEWYMPVPAR